MSEKLISRRGAFSLLGLAAALALPTTVLTTSDARNDVKRGVQAAMSDVRHGTPPANSDVKRGEWPASSDVRHGAECTCSPPSP